MFYIHYAYVLFFSHVLEYPESVIRRALGWMIANWLWGKGVLF